MEIESLKNTIRELEQQGESLELVRLRLELRNRLLPQRENVGGLWAGSHEPVELDEILDRYWKYIQKGSPDECWVWSGPYSKSGYGLFTSIGKDLKMSKAQVANRFTLMVNGITIPPGMKACHKCDNPPCCNLKHIFLGTQRDNILDMFRKGRANRPFGERQHLSKLTEDQVREIKSIKNHWYGMKAELGRKYGVNEVTIGYIMSGKTWKHVQP